MQDRRRVVPASIATAFAQDNADTAKAQWRRVADQIWPKLAETDSPCSTRPEKDVLAFMAV